MKQKGFAPVVILLLIALGVIFAPIPSIVKENVECFPCPPDTEASQCPKCPQKGNTYWKPSIFQKVAGKLSKPGWLTDIINPRPTPSSVTPENSSQTPDPTANWKTYVHPKLKYSFSYPVDTELEIMDDKVIVRIDPADPRTIVGICPRYISFSLVASNSQAQTSQNEYSCIYESSILSEKVFVETQYSKDNATLNNQILSTFKFLNKADEGTLQATVIRSPTCAGPATDEEGCEGPYANGKFQIKKLSNGEIVQTVTTDKNGALTVSLASGTYTLQNIETGIGKRISNSNFTITSGETTIQRFDVDTGIR